MLAQSDLQRNFFSEGKLGSLICKNSAQSDLQLNCFFEGKLSSPICKNSAYFDPQLNCFFEGKLSSMIGQSDQKLNIPSSVSGLSPFGVDLYSMSSYL